MGQSSGQSSTGVPADGPTIALGIDTATSVCAVALWRFDPTTGHSEALAAQAEPLSRGQAERLLPLVGEVLAQAGLDYAAIHRYGVTIGPGAFTGLRVGLAAARGLALASGRPLMGITGLEAFAHAAVHGLGGTSVSTGRPLLVAIDSRREDFYLQAFDAAGGALTPPEAVLPADVPAFAARLAGPPVLLGDAAPAVAAVLAAAGCDHITADLAPEGPALAVARLAAMATPATLAAHPANPLYIRAPDVTVAPPGAGR
ncbi:tRNA (adenosine(37)-N6)-threonylcarbamoyltransferase complex dimerization subunit type 1 TsaB [Nitrospirillum sp. BR 11828]|uniref:tRNA (adenosine(37)-N6)-threonylcarbamoyltransferase complex dimerization subunit type 1 TsaB n=1 Tax=Nitrospirillum sp. BR 11828 TaxID=3104325 RepID=UPI002ACABEAB|nr:tRNA (adenosine(37)-N6)-threonylcarbamoyltransferase complex dimerization subunit type 1 TsaB [Nitrospirillum sp. BR 11828]MDZ5646803.1 tRNA (adenosine(37)-N6)-threonylcarbamoyltransferase complex dimerization subunit type 1 TsaB [Nitrospirillum sp. BR 11828]